MNSGHEGIRGGFDRPDFSPGSAPTGPRVGPPVETTRAEIAARDEQRRQDEIRVNRQRRRRLLMAIGGAIIVVALIVFAMVWFWGDDRWMQAAAMI